MTRSTLEKNLMSDDANANEPDIDYRWIVTDPDLLGGRPTVRGTRISVSLVLECLSIGMSAKDIAGDYPGFPEESVPEVLRFASRHVAA